MLTKLAYSLTLLSLVFACTSEEKAAPEEPVQATTEQTSAQVDAEDTAAKAAQAEADAQKQKEAEELAAAQEAAKMQQATEATPAGSSGEVPTGELLSEESCQSGGDMRSIKTIKPENKLCSVIYAKFGNESEVAWAHNDGSYCQQVVDRIAEKLSAAGFTCSGNGGTRSNQANPAAAAQPEEAAQQPEEAAPPPATDEPATEGE